MKVQSTAWAVAKPITSHRRRCGRSREAASQAAAAELAEGLSAARTAQARVKMMQLTWPLCVARFRAKWNQLGVKKPRQNGAIWLPHGDANAIPRP